MEKRIFTFKQKLLLLLFISSPLFLFSQGQGQDKSQAFDPHWYISLNGGISQFWGEVSGQGFFERIPNDKFMGGAAVGYQLSPVFGLRGNFQYGSIYSEKASLVQVPGSGWTQLEMEASPMIDYSIQGTLSLINLFSTYKSERIFDLYMIAGVGLSMWESELINQDNGSIVNSADVSEGYVPAGAGISFNLSRSVNLGLEQVFNVVNGDMVDAKTDGSDNDIYSNTRLNLTFKFGQGDDLKDMAENFDQVNYYVKPRVFQRHGDRVRFTFSGDIPEDYFSEKTAMKISPKLTYKGKSTVLKPVFLKGKEVSGDGQIITSDGGSFSQDYDVTFENGMEDAELKVSSIAFIPVARPVNEDATDSNIKENDKAVTLPERTVGEGTIITGQRVVFDPTKVTGDILSKANAPEYGMLARHGYEKETILSDQAAVYFKINLAYLNWRLPLNVNRNAEKNVEKLKQFLDKGWKIKNIELNAWASPDGPQDFNATLSEKRAETGMDVLKNLFDELNMSIEKVTVDKQAKGEDWNGFMEAIENSDIEDKEIILNVVRSQPNLKKREQEIRNMAIVFKEVEEKILPPLRRVEMKVNSFEPKHSDQELASMALNDAESLKKNELLYAATLHEDLDKKLEIYQKAVKLFPGSPRAYNNVAYIYLAKGEYNKAKEELRQAEKIAPKHAGVLNNLGIIAGIEKNYAKAEAYFEKAQKEGLSTNYYMGVLNITKGNYAKALELMQYKDCDYNVALAHMVSEDVDKAISTLECVPESAQKNYLMAVAAARKENKSMMFEHLVKAIKIDKAYKEKAKSDKEFINYFDAPDFKSLVK